MKKINTDSRVQKWIKATNWTRM